MWRPAANLLTGLANPSSNPAARLSMPQQIIAIPMRPLLSLAEPAHAAERCRSLRPASVVPYIMPGFLLAKKAAVLNRPRVEGCPDQSHAVQLRRKRSASL